MENPKPMSAQRLAEIERRLLSFKNLKVYSQDEERYLYDVGDLLAFVGVLTRALEKYEFCCLDVQCNHARCEIARTALGKDKS